MIVLGETVAEVIQGLAAANTVERLTPLTIVCAALGLAIGFGMWWVYYDFVARRPVRQQFYVALAWVYLHTVMLIGIVFVGTGVAHGLVAAGAPRIDPFAARLLFSGLGVMLLAVAVIETTLARASDEPTHPVVSPVLKVAVAVVLFVLALLDPAIPTAVAFVIAIAALAVQSTYGAVVWYRPRAAAP
jgi:low temperature requirement protein LtrA